MKRKKTMIVIFYDRKNRREVSSDQLLAVNVVRMIATANEEELIPSGRRYHPKTSEALPIELLQPEESSTWHSWKPEMIVKYTHLVEEVIGTLAYKTPNCPEHQNWDVFLNESDLVFLRCKS